MADQEVSTRGFLPHWDVPGATQFLTWRLADSLPAEVFARLADEHRSPELRPKLWKRVDEFLDGGAGECVLQNPVAANILAERLLADHGTLYVLHAFVIMPNHVHVVLTISPDIRLAPLVKTLKGGSSLSINRAIRRTGRLWQPDYFDRLIRSDEHFRRTVEYVHWNPVKARLVVDPKSYPFSTDHPRFESALRWARPGAAE